MVIDSGGWLGICVVYAPRTTSIKKKLKNKKNKTASPLRMCRYFWRRVDRKVLVGEPEIMAKATSRMSVYELERLERIKENEKMLEELFPKGTQGIFEETKKPIKKRRQTDRNCRVTGSGTSSDCLSNPSHSDEETSLRNANNWISK